MFYDAVSIIHDDITTAKPYPYIAIFMSVSVRSSKDQQ